MIGLIMLMGLVTKNAILLVDFANRAQEGASVPEALLQAGQIRMRPIIMTTAAMVFGMLPLALALNDGGELQAPMGRAIIGGVITSTLLDAGGRAGAVERAGRRQPQPVAASRGVQARSRARGRVRRATARAPAAGAEVTPQNAAADTRRSSRRCRRRPWAAPCRSRG